jgi:hypothetical protein
LKFQKRIQNSSQGDEDQGERFKKKRYLRAVPQTVKDKRQFLLFGNMLYRTLAELLVVVDCLARIHNEKKLH